MGKFRGAARNSLEIGIMAASLALVFGTCAGIAIQRFARFRLRLVFSFMLMAPLVVPEVILGLSLRRTVRAARIQRALVRALFRYGPLSVRLLFLVFGVGLVADALVNHSALW